jgi:predicted NBD/HSP70 family sugar kinase
MMGDGALSGFPGNGSPSVLRQLNLARVLRTIRAQGPLPRSAVVRASGLSKPTVNEVVEALLDAGLIVEFFDDGAVRPRRPGPKARLLRFNSRRWLVVGVDIGAAKILALLSDLDGTVLASVRRSTPRQGTKEVLQSVRQIVAEAVAQAGVSRESIAVVVVGTPGVIDPTTDIVHFVPQFPEWHGQPLKELLRISLTAPVLVRSEAHLAVAGEHWRGAATDARNAVYVQMGVGVGMGILIDGNVYRGGAGAAGEIGYMLVDGVLVESTTRFGPFETAVGATAFARLAAEAVAAGEGEAILAAARGEEPGPAAVLEAAAAGDPTARGITDRILDTLARGLVNVATILNPEIIVLGGGLSASLETHLPRLQQVLTAAMPIPPRIQIAALADQAVAMGALRLGIDHMEVRLFKELSALIAT